MSIGAAGDAYEDIRVPAGDVLILRLLAHDPAGINRVLVQCFQFSMANSNRVKFAIGCSAIDSDDRVPSNSIDVSVPIPENAALGKWGIQMIEFTNGRGYKSSFYRGQGKFDDVVFEVVAPPSKEDVPLSLSSVKITGLRRGA
jgi:hypothetical protein